MKPEQYLARQERFGVVGGIIGAILFVAFGVWGNIATPEPNVAIAILGTFYLGALGFVVGAVFGGVLSTPQRK